MNISPLERRVLAVGTVIALHAVILGIATAVQAAVAGTGSVPALPREPLLPTAVGLLLAHTSLGAIWWARSSWLSYAKTLVAVLATATLWVLLIGVLPITTIEQKAAAGWAASLATQVVLVGLGAALLNRSRFTILFLLLWTAVVGVLLGAGRRVAESFGWHLADVLKSEWFYQLQLLAVCNAALAVGLLAAVRLSPNWNVRLLAAALVLVVAVLATPLLMTAAFAGKVGASFAEKVGASFAEVVWLLLAQGLFLLVTLAPLEAARVVREAS